MEAQRPSWSEEELSYPTAREREVQPYPESDKLQPIAVEESGVVAEGIMLQAGSRSPERIPETPETEHITEKQLELRHEIQDDPARSSAVSIGSVVADLPTRLPGLSKEVSGSTSGPTSSPTTSTSLQGDNDAVSGHGQPSLYRQAIQIGFVSGICITVLFALVQILFR